MHDNERDVSCGKPTPARGPRGTDDLLRILGDPRNGLGG